MPVRTDEPSIKQAMAALDPRKIGVLENIRDGLVRSTFDSDDADVVVRHRTASRAHGTAKRACRTLQDLGFAERFGTEWSLTPADELALSSRGSAS